MGSRLADDTGVQIAVTDAVLRITLDRPDRKNALTPAMIGRIITALEAAQVDQSLRVILVGSSGADFCSGADIVAANAKAGDKPRTGSLQRRMAVQSSRLIELLLTVQLPVVCAVRGWAAGIGCQIALAADFTVASSTAQLWEPFTDQGFTADSGATWLLPRLIGVARAKEMLLLGERVDGARAAEWGLVHRAVDPGQLDGAADALVQRLATGPTVALGLTKACLASSLELTLREAMAKEAFALELSSRTADFREGIAAFRERRDPRYEGR